MFSALALWLYSTVSRRYHDAYNNGRKKSIRVPATVISIGNISTGGTGKSPFARFIAAECLRLGVTCAIISRGYGRKGKGLVVVSDGKTMLAEVGQAGDEAFMNAEALLRLGFQIPVIVHSDKVLAAQYAVERFSSQCIIVDDGFQHRRLYRDCDIVLVDRFTLNNPTLLPVGRLREPLTALQRAHIIVGMNGVHCDELSAFAPKSFCITARVVPGQPASLTGENLQGGSLLAVAGIAHPERFLSSLAQSGCRISAHQWYPDHHRFSMGDVEQIIKMAHNKTCWGVICTEKDFVKLRHFGEFFTKNKMPLLWLPIELNVSGALPVENYFNNTINQV